MDLNSILYGGGQPQQSTPQTFVPQVPAGVLAAQAPIPPQQMQLPPPVTAPQEVAPQGFMEKLRSDPAISQTMMMMGARLMQGPRRGQDELGALGDAAMIGLTAHNMLQQNKKEEVVMQQEQARKDKLATADLEASKASTEATKLKTAQAAELFPETKAKVAEDIKAMKAAGKASEAKALADTWKNDPKRLADAWALDVKKVNAQISADYARAGASRASADNSRASAEQTRAETADPQKYMRPSSTAAGKPKDWQAGFAKFASDNMYDLAKPAELAAAQQAYQATVDYGRVLGGGAEAPAPQAPSASKEIDEASIQANMAKYGKTRAEVLDAAKAQGYTFKGK